ncbi:MAG: undecaprenyl-diphosphatase UppP [Syntrophobacterales bacterium]|nr:undecaprenyl-diphosphatase UppP [Syntrophobacterales bacterium]
MEIATALILGIVEGFSEFLPISSTGHLILAGKLLGLAESEFVKSFDIAIQLGAILSVVVLYWRELLVDWETIKKVAIAFLPTGVIGFVLYKIIKTILLGSAAVVLWSLLIGGIVLIVFEMLHREKDDATKSLSEITYLQSFLIGVFQSLAVIPGVSRSAATIVGGLILGMKRTMIVEFSFLLAVPTMLAATVYDLYKNGAIFSVLQLNYLAVGFLTSFIVALASIKFLIRFVQNHTFILFGIYRIALVLVWFALF